jgi:hypothetical protein
MVGPEQPTLAPVGIAIVGRRLRGVLTASTSVGIVTIVR